MNIHYQIFGNSSNPPMLLIAGLGEQMISWPDEFCFILAESGFFVVRFDNRDTGSSTKMELCGIPDLNAAWAAYFSGDPIVAPYTLADMAADSVGLLDGLNIERSYVCGFSLGGMIAQNMVFNHKDRILGMICMGTSTGEMHLPPPTSEAQYAMSMPPPQTRVEYIKHMVSIFSTFSGGSNLYDPECRSRIAAESYDTCYYPQGFLRQSMAMLADGSRRSRLEKIDLPTLVLHGALDPVARPEHGYAIADAVKSTKIKIVPEWGHGLDYPKLWPDLIEFIQSIKVWN